jgi:O-palmitoleoyl-L-serine hydrolase
MIMFKTSRVFSLLCALLVSACVPDSSSPVEADEPAADVQTKASAIGGGIVDTCLLDPVPNPDTPISPPVLVTLDSASHAKARCNDGSMGVYKIRRNPNSSRWLIWLDGGGSCDDDASCNARAAATPINVTSTLGVGTISGQGIFSSLPANNPVYHDANLVYIHYCSSDQWTGGKNGSVTPASDLTTAPANTWHFAGREIATAVISELLADHGLDDACDVTLAGGSAGAAGVLSLVDEIGAMLPSAARYQGLVDGGVPAKFNRYDLVSTYNMDPSHPHSVRDYTNDGISLWGGRGDQSCELAATPVNKEFCRIGSYLTRNGHISTPLLIINSIFDNVQLSRAFDAPAPYSCSGTKSYMCMYCDELRTELNSVDSNHSVFLRRSDEHISVLDNSRMNSTIGGTSMRDFITAWHASPATQNILRHACSAP